MTEEQQLFMGFSSQACSSGWPFLSPVDHILSELSTVTCSYCVALHSMAYGFIELDKAVIHVISLINFFVIVVFSLSVLLDKDNRLAKAS